MMAPLVGRTAERQSLLALLDDARAGDAGCVVLSGDAGVGKTRLLTAIIEVAEQRGMLTLVGHCIDFGEAGLPYLPFTEAFGRLAVERPDVAEGLLADFAPLARLLPVQRSMGAPASDDRLDRGALFEAVLGGFAAIAVNQPTLLVIEDVHWADQASRDLLGFLFSRVRGQHLAIVVSYRSDDLHRRHPLRRVAAEWARLPRIRRLDLPPLEAAEIRALVRSLRAEPLPEHELQQIVERAEGNAFFAEELLAATEQSAGPDVLPAELAELLLIRLDQLSERARNVVRVAAVAGRRVPHALLARVTALPDDELDAALREAIDSHALEPSGESGYGFRHALLAEATYDDLLPGERVRLHAAYANALVDATLAGTAAELARHARESNDLGTAFVASVQAGDDAMALAAPQEAMRHYESALELESAAPPGCASGGVRLVCAAADAAAAAGHQFRALNLVRDALAVLPATARAEDRATLLGALASAALRVETDTDAFAATAEALQLVPTEPPSTLRAELAALHARAAATIGRDGEAARWANDAMDAARLLGEASTVADAQTTLALLQRRAGDPVAAAQLLDAAIEQAVAAGEITAELRSRWNLGNLHYERGALDDAAAAYRGGATRAREAGRRWSDYGLEARALLALVEYERGDWDASAALTSITGEMPPPLADALLSAVGMSVRAGRGELDALDLVAVLRPRWRLDGLLAVLTAGPAIDLYAIQGRPDAALALHDEVVSTLGSLWQQEWFLARIRLSALSMATVTSTLPGHTAALRATTAARAGSLIEAARTAAARGVPQGRQLGAEGIAWLARAEAEWARFRWLAGEDVPDVEEHVQLWLRSVEGFGYGHLYEQARSRARLAAVLRAAGRLDEAREHVGVALDFAKRVGARSLVEELHAVGAAPTARRGGGRASLTERERDVLALLVDARTNRQIAKQLYISEKTVSVHVSNILAKFGVRNRAEAAAIARSEFRAGSDGSDGSLAG